MQFSLPSKRRAARFLVVFYAAMMLLFFGFYTVIGAVVDVFGPMFNVWLSITWPMAFRFDQYHTVLLLIGLGTAALESRATEVGN